MVQALSAHSAFYHGSGRHHRVADSESVRRNRAGIRFRVSHVFALKLAFFFFFFLEDEKDNWDKYLRTLPFSAKKIVMSRMIMFAGFQFACFLYSSLCGVISYLIYAEYPLMSYVVFAFVMLAFSLIGMLVVVPFSYQLGGRGVQQVVMFIFFMPLMIAGQLQNLGVSQETMTKIFLYAAIIFLIVLPFASFKFSVRFFQKKIIC